MRLVDLPQWLRFERRNTSDPHIKPAGGDWGSEYVATCHIPVATLAEAHGVEFLCQKCFAKNGGRVGTHMVLCWFRDRGVPDDAEPGPGRWTPQGTSFEDLTFVPGVPPMAKSVLLTGGGCGWHGFVTNGDAT